ncbi:MAG: alpha/beta hydrolase [Akkermansiaceae bacterium]|nr:alpha/beta hydrolase [Akkermansiaceae bacterium]
MLPTYHPLPHGVTRAAAIRYTPERWPAPQVADIYYRPGAAPAPAVLLIHGGSWKESQGARWTMDGIARHLARRGYVVVNAGYRGYPDYLYPAPVDDLREAIHWMRGNAATYGIDPNRIATYGFSAGAHLAAQVALRDGNPEQVRAIVCGSAPFDLTLYPGGDIVPAFLGGRIDKIPAKFREASPVNHVTRRSPPIFIYQGTRDTLVQPEHATRMQQAYARHGLATQVHWLPGSTHAGALIAPGHVVEDAIDFLDRNLKP